MDYFEIGYQDGANGQQPSHERSHIHEYAEGWNQGIMEKLHEDMMKMQNRMYIQEHKC